MGLSLIYVVLSKNLIKPQYKHFKLPIWIRQILYFGFFIDKIEELPYTTTVAGMTWYDVVFFYYKQNTFVKDKMFIFSFFAYDTTMYIM